jgi:hypothetical protein
VLVVPKAPSPLPLCRRTPHCGGVLAHGQCSESRVIQVNRRMIFKLSDLEIIKLGIGWYGRSAWGWADGVFLLVRVSSPRHLRVNGWRESRDVGGIQLNPGKSKLIQVDQGCGVNRILTGRGGGN